MEEVTVVELFSAAFFIALINIIFIDLILAGDNAIVIGMAARKLPAHIQKKAILLGTGGAVLLRIAATLVVVWLLNIPWLLAIGGAMLVYIAYKVLVDESGHETIDAKESLWPAVRTIVIADAAMGLDNVIAVAGASQRHMILVVLGLLISVPIVIWGSTLFIKLLGRFPWIAYVGSAVLAYTASHMITEEPRLAPFFADKPVVKYVFIILTILGVLGAGYAAKQRQRRREQNNKRPSRHATR
ncbi:TerC family protein [Paenibacillus woosongensis]|uniref:YjbE family putative metal transport protein n=1 Tax=Paenibacillus woosongensis TaxID=307580 RepID=A0A7X2YZX0_9BACL|nr:TerC family protein [Paenibacillus woosongensis]MUG45036.1 YjbE family putative metal transport protein [Paenibacillus woosongensis]